MFTDRQLAEAALDAGYISLEELEAIVPPARSNGHSLTVALSQWGLDEERITYLHAALLGLPYLQPDHYHIPGEVLTILPQPLQKRLCTFPLAYEIKSAEERLYVAIIPSMSEEQLPYLAELLDMCIKPVAASCTAIRRMIDRDVSGMKLGQEQPLLELAHLQLPASIFSAAREFNPPVQGHLAA